MLSKDTALFAVERQSTCVPCVMMRMVMVVTMTKKYTCVVMKLGELASKRT